MSHVSYPCKSRLLIRNVLFSPACETKLTLNSCNVKLTNYAAETRVAAKLQASSQLQHAYTLCQFIYLRNRVMLVSKNNKLE